MTFFSQAFYADLVLIYFRIFNHNVQSYMQYFLQLVVSYGQFANNENDCNDAVFVTDESVIAGQRS